MRLTIVANETQQAALMPSVQPGSATLWVSDVHEGANSDSDVLVDLLFEPDEQRIALLQSLSKPVVINAVAHTLQHLNFTGVRINAWPFFLEKEVIEAATNTNDKTIVEEALGMLGKKVQWLPDDAGFISARVVSMIINEAYLALEEGVSTKEAINTAMKLGTAYPYGPFEWLEKIGSENVAALLQKLAETKPHYLPAQNMIAEV